MRWRDHRSAVVLAVFAWAGCDCEDVGLGQGSSRIATSRAAIDFGRVFLGSESAQELELTAPGDLPVRFSVSLAGDAFGLLAAPAAGTIAANGTRDIDVLFRPGRAGRIEARLVFDSDATEDSQIEVLVFGEGVSPPDCEDGNGCTVDSFDLVEARCVHRAEALSCSDFSACTVSDVCVEGACLGEARSCDDDNPCTDDFCDPATGCLNQPTQACDDRNPCTVDRCDIAGGCVHESATDGTPCDDFEVCTTADICFGGDCVGVSIPEGTICDDGDPCSIHDRCVMGECKDPDYRDPQIGELVYSSTVGPLAPDAPANPILDRDGAAYVGLADGVGSVDECGRTRWLRHDLGEPTWRAATSLPGRLLVPFGARIIAIDARDGATIREIDLAGQLPAPAGTSSTATVTARIVDMALRGSGAVVASVVQTVDDGERAREHGLLAEVDRTLTIATVFRRLGPNSARRVVVDRDEALVVVLSSGDADRLVRFGLDGLPGTSWSTAATSTAVTEIALGGQGEALWTHGLVRVTTTGTASVLLEPGRPFAAGSPIVGDAARIHVLRPVDVRPPNLIDTWEVVALTATLAMGRTASIAWSVPVPADLEAVSPAIDGAGTLYLPTRDGVLVAIGPDGGVLFRAALGIPLDDARELALGITPRGDVVLSGDGRVLSVRGFAPLAGSPWPRHRRDNLSTGHR